MSILWSLQLKKTENWHGDNQRRAIKVDKELLYENRLRNRILQFGKTKTLKEYSKESKSIRCLASKNTKYTLNIFKKSTLRVIGKNFSVMNKHIKLIMPRDAAGHKNK